MCSPFFLKRDKSQKVYINHIIQVERLYRDVRAYAIPGGSEEIMLDLSIRQALRVHKALGMKL